MPSDRDGDGIVDERDLVMRVDDAELPFLASSGRPAWTYDPKSSAIDFAPLFIPRPESVIRVSYLTCPFG